MIPDTFRSLSPVAPLLDKVLQLGRKRTRALDDDLVRDCVLGIYCTNPAAFTSRDGLPPPPAPRTIMAALTFGVDLKYRAERPYEVSTVRGVEEHSCTVEIEVCWLIWRAFQRILHLPPEKPLVLSDVVSSTAARHADARALCEILALLILIGHPEAAKK